MKQAIIGFGFLMITLLTVMIVMALIKENTEQNVLEQSVELAVYQSLQEGMDEGEDPGTLFVVNLAKLIDEELVSIDILASDEDMGILSVTVVKEFENFGNKRSISVTRTVIYEQEVA